MSKILKSVTLGDVKNGGIFRALGKEFVKLDADEHGCLVLAKDIWTRMPFRDGDDRNAPTICAGARLCHIWVTAWQSLQRTALR